MPRAYNGFTVNSKLNHGGPYSTWKAPKAGWCVCDHLGFNIIHDDKGRVFTDENTATALCEALNKSSTETDVCKYV